MSQVDLFEARTSRDAATKRVLGNNLPWMLCAMNMLEHEIRRGREMTGEQMRYRLISLGLPRPAHPNAWGALTLNAVRQGLLADTGRIESMTSGRSHARKTTVWRRV